MKEDVIQLINKSGCFDLQFRKDTKYNRPNSPTYYRWKAQFVVIDAPNKLEKIKNVLGCGLIHVAKDQTRFSVQNIDEQKNSVIPYFEEHQLIERKNSDFNLWKKAVDIIFQNKGINISNWKKHDFDTLIKLQKSINKSKPAKWLAEAKNIAAVLKK